MQLEVGNVIEGKVTGITKFGAFVELPGGKTGMVHISEVSSTYVKEIGDHLAENQMVKVKVLSITDDGKVSLSIKKCQEAPAFSPQSPSTSAAPPMRSGGFVPPKRPFAPRGEARGWQPKKVINDNLSFEDMLTRFKQTSDDKMSDLKKSFDGRRSASKSKPNKQ